MIAGACNATLRFFYNEAFRHEALFMLDELLEKTPAAALRIAVLFAGSLMTLPAAAQQPEPAPSAPALPPEPSRNVARSIEFSAANIAFAFDLLDRDRNGRISREEAAAIRGVARNFERADLDQDNSLSRSEFDNAMKQSKPP